MKKKLLGVLLSLAMALNFTVVSAFAVEKPTITVETDANAVEAGATVDLSVSITGNTGFTNYEWNIQYDKDRLELITIVSDLDIVANPNHPKTGFGYATCARTNAYNEDAELFTLTFTVKEDAKTGNAEVKIESNNFKNNGVAIDADYVVGGVTVNGSATGGSTTGGSTTGGSTTGGSTTGGSTTGGSTTGGSTTGGSTTGGSTTGGSTTGGSTTGGSTTGGSTTGGSTTGGSTTGGSTTGGSTTGGSTTGGSTTGGSTTGGSTTGGSTTGGSTTGGSTTGGSTTGGSTTGGSTTGGSTTGGGETESIVIDNKTIGVAAASTIYDSENKSLTVTCDQPCVVMIQAADGTLTRLIGTRNSDNTYIFDVSGLPKAAKVVVATKGDANGDGETNAADLALINRAILQGKQIGKFDTMICDVNGDGVVNAADLALMNHQYLRGEQLSWDA